MERWKRRAVELVGGLATTDNRDPAVIPYRPQKTKIANNERRTLPVASAESVGLSSARLAEMLRELEDERRANIHSILVVRRGRVVCEAAAPGYSSTLWHLSHSMSKTVTGMAIGLLVDSGELSVEERLVDIFPEIHYGDARFADITVEHLLAMSTGVKFSELGVVTESDWISAYFDSELAFAPGAKFAYNSMNSYILAKIVVRRAGESLASLVERRIFAPLGIKSYLWESAPDGEEKGGFGLYLSVESWAKLGLMMLGGGVYGGRRILSQKWVGEMLTTRSISPESTGDFNYGYHLWVHRECDEFLFSGMLGQNVWVSPSTETVVVITAGNSELFQQSPALYIIRKYLAREESHERVLFGRRALRFAIDRFFETRGHARPLSPRGGILAFLGFENARPFDKSWNPALGKYLMRRNNDSLLPVFVRCLQNNLVAGIDSFELRREGESLILEVKGADGEHRLEIGLYSHAASVLDFNGEKYRVMALGEATYDAAGAPLYRIELVFPELPNTRVIELHSGGDSALLARFYETPGAKIAAPLLESLPIMNPKVSFAKQLLDRRFGGDFLEKRLERIFSPSLLLVREGAPRAAEMLLYEEETASAENASVSAVIKLLLRFLKEDPLPEPIVDEGEEAESPGVLGSVLERIKKLIKRD